MLPLLTLLNYGSQISPISIPLVSGMKNIPYKQAIVQKIKNSKNPQLSPRCETIGSQINNVTDDISQFNPVINETAKARTESGNNSGTIIHGTGPKAIPNEKTSISNETRAMSSRRTSKIMQLLAQMMIQSMKSYVQVFQRRKKLSM